MQKSSLCISAQNEMGGPNFRASIMTWFDLMRTRVQRAGLGHFCNYLTIDPGLWIYDLT